MKSRTLLIVSCAFCLTGMASGALIIVAPTDSTAGSLQITEDIVFTSTATGGFNRIVLQNLSTSDGTITSTGISPDLGYVIDGTAGSGASTFQDSRQNTFGDLSIGDAQFFLSSGVSFTAVGQEFELSSGTYVLAPVSGFNPASTQTFTGQMFLANNSGSRVSEVATVPEPSTATVFALAGAGMAMVRRRR